MKKSILLLALLMLFTATTSYSQYGSSIGILTGLSAGRNVDIPAAASDCGVDEAGFGGVILVELNGIPDVPFYCLDLCTGIAINDTIVDSAATIPEAIYITNNYYPAVPSPSLSNDDEACAVQLAIWHFRNNLDISQVSVDGIGDAAIRARALVIIAETIANSGGSVLDITLEILPAVNPNDFYVRTTDTAGNPVSVDSIMLSITGGGTLSTYLVSTDVTGNSSDVIVSGAVSGSEISASAEVEIPSGVTYAGYSSVLQLLVLAETTTGIRTSTILWGALPVELSSFSSYVHGRNVDLNWITTNESNNSGFDIERSIANSVEWVKVGHVQGFGTSQTSHNYSFSDRNLTSGKYSYRLKQIDYNGNFEYFNLVGDIIIGVPNKFELSQNFPNPFNPSTKINYQIPNDAIVSLKVFDNSGKEVATLVNGSKAAGFHSANFNAKNLSSGVYFYKLETEGFTKVMKMALVK